MKTTVLLILPDAGQARALTELLDQAGGYEVQSVRMPEEFADAVLSFTPELVIIDEQLPPDDMQAWARVITGLSPQTRILDLSTSSDESRKLELTVHGYLREPFEPAAFLREVRRVLHADLTIVADGA